MIRKRQKNNIFVNFMYKYNIRKYAFSGFTLVELLAVIVILSVIALITTPIVIAQIESAREKSFFESARNTLDAGDIYVLLKHDMSKEGTDIQELDLKNKINYSGLIFKNSSEQYILKNFTNGSYCASGPRDDLIVRKGNCKESSLYADLSLSIKERTTRKITVMATASDDTGIASYAYCIDDCSNESNWNTNEKNEYTFDSLTYSKRYEIYVRVTNRIDKVTEKTIEVITENLPTASYSVSPSGWAKSKTVTITYPNEVENYLVIHSGRALMDGEVISVGERKKINGTSAQIIFETNGTIEAITSDGYNEASSSTLTISQIDITSPENVSVEIGTVTSNSIQVIASGYDNESGISKYEFQVDGGAWIDNGTNNIYLFSNLTSGNYTYKVRLTNNVGDTIESEARTQSTVTIITPSYGVNPSGWAKSKTATITYQNGYTNQFRVLSGNATYNGTTVNNNIWITISGTSAGIVFNSNGTIEARSTDGINTVTSSTLTVNQIDVTNPEGVNVGFGTVTSKSIQVIASGYDNESGIAKYEFQSNGGTWIDNGTNNTYLFNNLSSGTTYTYKVRLTNYAGGITESEAKSQKTIPENEVGFDLAKGVNAPKLVSGMTPIKWVNGVETVTTESDPDWYDYAAKKWANVKTKDGSYWVWIPRYAYKITSGYHSSTTGTIDIKFLKGVSNVVVDETSIQSSGYQAGVKDTSMYYFVHPAFQNNINQYGYWVAKFEPTAVEGVANGFVADWTCPTSGDNVSTKTIKVIPNVSSWRCNTIANAYIATVAMKNKAIYGWNSSQVDTHLMTNLEWGAVAYLSNSTYGAQAKIFVNNSQNYITGCAGNTVSAAAYNGCQNAYNTTIGVKASTTYNITGIYDMSGGSWERTMSVYNNLISNGGFSTQDYNNIPSYHITKYTTPTANLLNNVGMAYDSSVYGDSVYETSNNANRYNGSSWVGTNQGGWFGEQSFLPYTSGSWFTRGDGFNELTLVGVNAFTVTTGGVGSYNSFRPVVSYLQ